MGIFLAALWFFYFAHIGKSALSVYARLFAESDFKNANVETIVNIAPTVRPELISPGVTITGFSRQQRPIEEYDLGVFPADLQPLIERQTHADRQYDVFTPQTTIDSYQSESSPMGDFTFHTTVYQGKYTIIYSLRENPNLLIKYQANCDEIWRSNDTGIPMVHPLLTDHWYSQDAAKHGLSVRTLFVSPPALLCHERFGKCHFDVDQNKYEKCFRDWGTVRYMLMERSPGMDLFDMRSVFNHGAVPFTRALSIGVLLIQALAKLHMEAGIVHGDIHLGNVMVETVENGKPGEKRVKFIDFARASRRKNLTNVPVFEPGYYDHFMYTQWQLEGFAWSARDDLMKAIQVIATLMNDISYSEFEKSISEENFEDHLEYKKTSYIFEIPNMFSPVESLFVPKTMKLEIRSRLLHVLTLVRNLSDINTIPPYGEIVYAFVECKQLIDSFR